MNNNILPPARRNLEARQARYALRVAGRLSEHANALPPDISERLRFAREAALARARAARTPQQAAAPRRGASWWLRLASVAPLALLVLGLGVIDELHDRSELQAAVEVDAALLADALPPDAYRDAGFLEFLRTSQE